MLSAQRRKEITDQIYAEPCTINFELLDSEEKAFAIRTVASARLHSKLSVTHFTAEQEKFIEREQKKIKRWL